MRVAFALFACALVHAAAAANDYTIPVNITIGALIDATAVNGTYKDLTEGEIVSA